MVVVEVVGVKLLEVDETQLFQQVVNSQYRVHLKYQESLEILM